MALTRSLPTMRLARVVGAGAPAAAISPAGVVDVIGSEIASDPSDPPPETALRQRAGGPFDRD